MFKKFLILLIVLICFSCNKTNKNTGKSIQDELPSIAFERSQGDSTSTYSEVIQFYKSLAKNYKNISINEFSDTDNGEPLHLVKFSSNVSNTEAPLRILINNGIHPGESDGIDASMLLFKALATGQFKPLNGVEIYSIPVYNIGGALDRNANTRTNQNGPSAYGFRGNAKNYDLNRDFIKSDTKNSKAFFEVFHQIQPDIFVDTHVSNGADYQYTLTHLFTQHNKLGKPLGQFLNQTFRPGVEKNLAEKNWEITPYVNVFNQPPEVGFSQFNDSPRYSTGYTSLFNSLGLMIETHMLKPYKQRVEGTLAMLKSIIEVSENHKEQIITLRQKQQKKFQLAKRYAFNYTVDRSKQSTLEFLGYKADTIKSAITGFDRLKYDPKSKFTKQVNYYNYFIASDTVDIPKAYIIPKQYTEIIGLLKWNNIEIERFTKDTLIEVEQYKIENYETRNSAYEGHYLHSNTSVTSEVILTNINLGDVIVYTAQPGIRYLLETLEPMAVDSFFNWNYFDSILQQKEGFSPYVFEDKALEILNNNPQLAKKFNALKKKDNKFKNNGYAQLDWIHKHSKYYESAHLSYPIYRLQP